MLGHGCVTSAIYVLPGQRCRYAPPRRRTSAIRSARAPRRRPRPAAIGAGRTSGRSCAIQPGEAPDQDQRYGEREDHAGVDGQFGHAPAERHPASAGQRQLRADGEDVPGGRDDADDQEWLELESAALQRPTIVRSSSSTTTMNSTLLTARVTVTWNGSRAAGSTRSCSPRTKTTTAMVSRASAIARNMTPRRRPAPGAASERPSRALAAAVAALRRPPAG